MSDFITSVLINPHVEVDRSRFPFTLPVFQNFESLAFPKPVTFFVGENGSGKSTLLEAMAVRFGFSAEGGSLSHTFSTFDSHSDMSEGILLSRKERPGDSLFLRAESFYNLATYLEQSNADFLGYGRFGSLHKRSHGQGFLDTVKQLKPHGLYLMDEPESALSVQGQFTMLSLMKQLVDEDSQLIIATHSPILLGFGGATIYRFSEEGIREVDYKETDPYMLTLDFLKNRNRYASYMGLPEL